LATDRRCLGPGGADQEGSTDQAENAHRPHAVFPPSVSESFFTTLAESIGEVTIQSEYRVLHQRIHAEMEALHRLATAGDLFKRLLKLGEIPYFNHQVEFAKAWRAKTELPPCQAPGLYQALIFQFAHVHSDVV
jgi:hypothetical protein